MPTELSSLAKNVKCFDWVEGESYKRSLEPYVTDDVSVCSLRLLGLGPGELLGVPQAFRC
jgi:hypothetical protein